MSDFLKCLPLVGTSDGPLFVEKEGTIQTLTNMRLRPGGFAEARGGFSELQPSGGTAADCIAAGAYSDVIQTSTSYGWVRSFDASKAVNSQYSVNYQLHPGGFEPFGNNAGSIQVQSALYWGADDRFSRIMVSIGSAAVGITVVYEYWNGAAWVSLTTAETITWTTGSRSPQFASWTLPSDWAATTVGDSGTGNVLKYWMRIRVTVVPGVGVGKVALARGFWSGMREIYSATQSPRTSATSGTLKRHGQSGTTEEWFPINSALYAAHASPARMVEYRGRVVLLNGKEQKTWDGANLLDLGPSNVPTYNANSTPAGTLGAGVWRYYAAFGYGPCQNTDAYQDRQDAQPLYGYGKATYLFEITTAAAQNVRFDSSGGVPTGTSSYAIFRTDDLTNVPAGDRANAPAYMIQSFRAGDGSTVYEQNWGLAAATYDDSTLSYVFPLQEAKAYDIAPPPRCKFPIIYQNRLMIGDDETWYISDPFTPDWFSQKSFKYIRLARASGGRHMGGVEFADQAVLYTEDQTWGVTNVEQDVPQLFPIHPTVGNVAPDAVASGDGRLIWPGKDGFYTWDGDSRHLPEKITKSYDTTFGRMSYETHGGSRAVIRDRCYIVSICAPGGTPSASYAYDMDTGQWSVWTLSGFASTLAPLALVHAPLGNADAGGVHALWGKVDYGTGAGEYGLFLDDLTTQDAGSNFTSSAVLFFKQPPSQAFTPQEVVAFYQAADGWATPSFSYGGGELGSSPGTIATRTPDTSADYSMIAGVFSGVSRGSASLKVTFSAVSAAGGTVNGQRLFGAILKGAASAFRRGAP